MKNFAKNTDKMKSKTNKVKIDITTKVEMKVKVVTKVKVENKRERSD